MIMHNSNQKPRARRYPLSFSIYYRKSGMSSWQKGKTINISHTGVLFFAEKNLSPEMKLEIHIPFPRQSTLTCQGTVVRIESGISTKTIFGTAVQMNHCQLLSSKES